MDTPNTAPLAGVRILDLSRLLPGPLGAQYLADLGADVIKIEDTLAGDYAPPSLRAVCNRNKRGAAVGSEASRRPGSAGCVGARRRRGDREFPSRRCRPPEGGLPNPVAAQSRTGVLQHYRLRPDRPAARHRRARPELRRVRRRRGADGLRVDQPAPVHPAGGRYPWRLADGGDGILAALGTMPSAAGADAGIDISIADSPLAAVVAAGPPSMRAAIRVGGRRRAGQAGWPAG